MPARPIHEYTDEQRRWLVQNVDASHVELERGFLREFGVTVTAESLRKMRAKLIANGRGEQEARSDLESEILQHVLEGSCSVTELCNLVDRGPATIREALASLHEQGYRVRVKNDQAEVAPLEHSGYTPIPLDHFRDGQWFRFGVVSDTHLCNRNSRLDVLNIAYDHFAAEGVHEVFVPGNWVDGEAPFNREELITAPGFERQVDYFIQHYPMRDGITTRILSGPDHEGWYARREGINVGRRMQQSAHDMGRTDLVDLGYAEVDIPFSAEGSDHAAIVRIVHPGGGSAYATSYKTQKIIESYQSGEKPDALLIGHFHKSGYFVNRSVHALLAGTTEDQTLFMRSKQLSAEVGFWVVNMLVDYDGTIKRFSPEWFGFYDRQYYQDKYPVGDAPTILVA